MSSQLVTPWPTINEQLTLSGGDLVLLAGRSGHGTSMAALNIAIHNAFEQGAPVEVISLECSSGDTLERALAHQLRINSEHFRWPDRLTDAELERIDALKADRRPVPFTAMGGPMSLAQIQMMVTVRGGGPEPLRVVMVDGLDLVRGGHWHSGHAEEVARGLKAMAVTHGLVVLATSHLAVDEWPRPTTRDGLDAGLAGVADAVLLVQQIAKDAAELTVVKTSIKPMVRRPVRVRWTPEYSLMAELATAGETAQIPVVVRTVGDALGGFRESLYATPDPYVDTPWDGFDQLLQLHGNRKVGIAAQRGTHEATVGRRLAAHAAQSGPVLLSTGYPPTIMPEDLVIDSEPSPTPEYVNDAIERMVASGLRPRVVVIERYERMRLEERPEDFTRADELEECGRRLGRARARCPIVVTTVVDQPPLYDNHVVTWAGVDSPASVMTAFCAGLVVLSRENDSTAFAQLFLDDAINHWIVHRIPWALPKGARRLPVAPVATPAAPSVAATVPAPRASAPAATTLLGAIKALETEYAGHRFRSRLEARWAVFFDALGVTWEYEAERYQLPSGKYLPDFWLPRQELFYEVKGVAPTASYQQLLRELTEGTGHRLALAVGSIPDPGRYKPGTEGESDFWMDLYDPSVDGSPVELQSWCRCPKCGFYDVVYDGISRLSACRCKQGTAYCGQPTNPLVLEAMRAARSARFEHGQSGAL